MNSITPKAKRVARRPVRTSTRPEPLKGALAGFVGGIAGTLAMDTTLLAWTLLDVDMNGV